MTLTKPPAGLIPKVNHDKNRSIDILKAMARYVNANKKIPSEWFDELKDLSVKKDLILVGKFPEDN